MGLRAGRAALRGRGGEGGSTDVAGVQGADCARQGACAAGQDAHRHGGDAFDHCGGFGRNAEKVEMVVRFIGGALSDNRAMERDIAWQLIRVLVGVPRPIAVSSSYPEGDRV